MPHRFTCRVYYEDTDLAGIVYYANYLKFIERARTEALRALGIGQTELRDRTGIVFAVRRVAVDYLSPARFEDQLVVTTTLLALGGASLDLAQDVLRDDRLLARCRVTIAAIRADGRPARLPAEIREQLRALA
jgi:acyl-CoA thioester hydrolase